MVSVQTEYKVEQVHMSREERYEQISLIIARAGQGAKLTQKQIAKRIGMAKSAHLAGILADMCYTGVLDWEWVETFNHLKARVFFVKGGD